MNIKQSKILEYKKMISRLGKVQLNMLKYLLTFDEKRKGIDFEQLYYTSVPPRKSVNYYSWGRDWSSITALFKRGLICKVIIGETHLENSKNFEHIIMENRAYFEYNMLTEIDCHVVISPKLNINILKKLIYEKLQEEY